MVTFRLLNNVAKQALFIVLVSPMLAMAQEIVEFEPAIQTDSVVAASPEYPGCLTFMAALDTAARNHPNVAIAQSDLISAEADLTEAKSLRKPQVSAFTRSGFGDEALVNTTIGNQIGLRASQRIYDFGDSRLAREAAEQGILAQESLILTAQSRAMMEAGLAYIDWLDASERLRATVDRADYFRRELSALKLALDAGGATLSEVAEISAESADAEADRYELEFEQQQAITRLQLATQSQRYKPCDDAGQSVAKTVDILANGETSNSILRNALNANPDLKALKSLAKQLDLEAERQSRSRLPVLEVVGITSLTTDRRFETLEARERIGLDATVPLLTGSSLSARTNKARAQARRAVSQADQERRTLEEQVLTTHKRALLLNAQLGRRQAVIEFRQMEFDAAKTGYESNIRTLPELVDIRLQLEDAQLSEIRTRYDYFRQALTLKSLSGALN